MIREMLAKQRAELQEEMRRREEALGRKPPAPAPAAAAPAVDREVVFWESIKNSTNPEDFKAYLAQYPKGAFTALAQTRLTPVPAPEPAPEPAATAGPSDPLADRNDPLQVASVAPTPVVEAPDPRLPKLGDRWEYVYKDPLSGASRDFAVEVIAAATDGILDEDNFSMYGKGARAYGRDAELLVIQQVWLFSPYLQAFGAARPGARWDDIRARNDNFCRTQACSYSARVAGTERVSTPAGTFDTVKVEVDLRAGSAAYSLHRRATFWYADAVKRFVRSTMRTYSGNTRSPDYDLELVSYKLK